MEPSVENLAKLREERLARARRMSPEEKLMAGPRLFVVAMEAMRAGIRLQYPGADEGRVREIMRQRLDKKRRRENRLLQKVGLRGRVI